MDEEKDRNGFRWGETGSILFFAAECFSWRGVCAAREGGSRQKVLKEQRSVEADLAAGCGGFIGGVEKLHEHNAVLGACTGAPVRIASIKLSISARKAFSKSNLGAGTGVTSVR